MDYLQTYNVPSGNQGGTTLVTVAIVVNLYKLVSKVLSQVVLMVSNWV